MTPDELLRGLDPTQREAVTSRAAPLAILAGAGSGKTRVLTRRIAWQARAGHLDPRHVLALTFTRKAAGELRDRLARLGGVHTVTAGTFHAVALAQLRRRAVDAGRTLPGLLERKARLLGPMLRVAGPEAALATAELASEIEWAKARLVKPDGYERAVAAAGRTPPHPASEVARVYADYERQKRRRGLVDFDDLIWECADALEIDDDFAAAQRWRFRHLFVDEFQDVSPAQFRLLQAWLGGRADLCVVGDVDQAIYGFAGADPSYLAAFASHFEHAGTVPGVVRLGSNYRSTPQVVAVSAAAFDTRSRARVRAARADGPPPVITAYPTDVDEARGVARAAQVAHRAGVPWSRMAVLYRVNAQSARFEEAFARARIPFRVRGAARYLDRPEVRVVLDELRAAARAAPARTLGEHLADLAHPGGDVSAERREHLDTLVRLGSEFLDSAGPPGSAGGAGAVDDFLAFLRATLRGHDADPTGGDAVDLVTFHRAKGLEFHTVFVTGLERGLVPISHAETADALAEEQRLLYVALSRAEHTLHLSWARERAMGARAAKRAASPWLPRLERALALARPESAPGERAPEHLAAARRRLGARGDRRPSVPEHDAELYAALVEWRRKLARASGTPAYVVFHDATLAAIAATRPGTRDELLALAGVGPVKAERYGDAVLGLVQQHRTAAPSGRH